MLRKILISILFLCLIGGLAHAGLNGVIATPAINYNVTSSSITAAIELSKVEYLGIWYQSTSVAATPNVTIKVEMSYDDVAAHFVTPEGMADIVTGCTDEVPHVERISCPPMAYIRFKITNTGNADTLVNIVIFIQELY